MKKPVPAIHILIALLFMIYVSERFFNRIPSNPLLYQQQLLYNTEQTFNSGGYSGYGVFIKLCGFPGADVYLLRNYFKGNQNVTISVSDLNYIIY